MQMADREIDKKKTSFWAGVQPNGPRNRKDPSWSKYDDAIGGGGEHPDIWK